MAAVESLRVTVAPEAADHVARLGLQREFRRMLDHVQATAPGLRGIDVTLEHDPEQQDTSRTVIWPRRDDPGHGNDRTDWEWGEWAVRNFRPEVFTQFSIISVYEAAHAG